MAILISGTTMSINDLSLDSLYSRLSVKVKPTGDKLDIYVDNYASKNNYQSKRLLPDIGLSMYYSIPYDRSVDGADILDIAHDYVKTKLELQFDLVGSPNIWIVDL